MKTSLYNPVFINPQAYYVFPQLYDIQPKTDDFIEKAVFAGQLKVHNLNDNSVKWYERTTSIDLNEFAGSNILISQYTKEGAVVLGEWQLPGMSGPSFDKSLVDAWFMSGLVNSDKPTELVGINGNKFATKNFAWNSRSGFNGYTANFNAWIYSSEKGILTRTDNRINIKSIANITGGLIEDITAEGIPSFKVSVKGVNGLRLGYQYVPNVGGALTRIVIKEDGIYTLPVSYGKYTGFIGLDIIPSCDITIEQVPLYEGSLCFDGIDDYCICDTMPIQTDYTVICKKVILASKTHTVASKRDDKTGVNNGAFQFEKLLGNSNTRVYSFGYLNQTSPTAINNIAVTYQTKDNYNGTFPLIVGSLSDTTQLTLGSTMPNLEALNGGIYYFALYDRSLTVEEIEREKIKLEDEWRKRGNIPLEYPFDFTKLYSNTEPHKLLLNDATSYYLFGGESGDRSFSVPSYKVKVTGLIDGDSVYIQAGGEWNIFVNITENGTYTIPATTYVNEAGYYEYSWQSMLNNGSKVTVEMLPL